MKKLFVLAIALMVISAPAFANLVVNGDFSTGDETGWTRWDSTQNPDGGWGSGFTWDASSGKGQLSVNNGSFGWYQALAVTPGTEYTINANWMGNGNTNWCEVLFFNDDNRTIYKQMDAPLDSSIISKVDVWGNYAMPFGTPSMAPITNYYYAPGLHTNKIVATGTTMYVVLKTGASNGSTVCVFDDVVVTPEPASMLALFAGLGGLIIRRKR